MYRDIQRWCQKCERCQSAKDAPTHLNVCVGHLPAPKPKQIPVADWHKTRHDQQAKDAPLREGQLVYLKKVGLRGRDKIKGASSSVVYKVLKVPDQKGSVYTIAPVDNLSHAKHVHHSLLKNKVEGVTTCAPSALIQTLETAPVEEPMQGGEWFLLVSEPTPAPNSCQLRPENPSPCRPDELEPSTMAVQRGNISPGFS